MARRKRISVKQCEAALRSTGGIMVAAAEALGVGRMVVQRLVAKHHKLRVVIAEATDETNDIAEGQLMLAIKRGEGWAVKYWLDNRAQDRGFGIRKLAFKDQDGQIQIPAVLVTNPRMTVEEWEAAAQPLIEERRAQLAPSSPSEIN